MTLPDVKALSTKYVNFSADHRPYENLSRYVEAGHLPPTSLIACWLDGDEDRLTWSDEPLTKEERAFILSACKRSLVEKMRELREGMKCLREMSDSY